MNSGVASRVTFFSVAGFDAVILPVEGRGVGIGADEAMVRDRHAVGVSAEIGQHGLGSCEGRLGIDHPFGFAERCAPVGKGIRVHQLVEIAEEGKLSGAVQCEQALREQPPQQLRQHPPCRKNPGLQATHRAPSDESPSPGKIMWMCG